jgi:hypothetical protein
VLDLGSGRCAFTPAGRTGGVARIGDRAWLRDAGPLVPRLVAAGVEFAVAGRLLGRRGARDARAFTPEPARRGVVTAIWSGATRPALPFRRATNGRWASRWMGERWPPRPGGCSRGARFRLLQRAARRERISGVWISEARWIERRTAAVTASRSPRTGSSTTWFGAGGHDGRLGLRRRALGDMQRLHSTPGSPAPAPAESSRGCGYPGTGSL